MGGQYSPEAINWQGTVHQERKAGGKSGSGALLIVGGKMPTVARDFVAGSDNGR